MKHIFYLLLFLYSVAVAQEKPVVNNKGILIPNHEYSDASITKTESHQYTIDMDKNGHYEFYVMQKGMDITVKLNDASGKQWVDKDSPNGYNGPENFELVALNSGKYLLQIIPFNDSTAPASGKYSVFVKKLTAAQVIKKQAIQKELAEENKKNVLTLDIDHFWDAYDHLKQCKTHQDSVQAFQEQYIDKATDGFKDFLLARNFTAEEYTATVAAFPKFYQSIRTNTYEVKKAVPFINEVFENFKKIYPGFKPFKVCFAIGNIRTGGTTSANFVLIGAEITTSARNTDLSEFKNSAMGKVLAGDTDIVQKIKNIVAHESVHTQQKNILDKNAEKCDLLYACLMEGSCDFIGELVVGNQINRVAQEFGDNHEAALWKEFNAELCDKAVKKWLYNYRTSKDRPADLGYYIGYKIAKNYYHKQADKQKAIVDILEMKDPKKFLEQSGYGEDLLTP